MSAYVATIEHNKRCCLAYTNARLEKVRPLFYELDQAILYGDCTG